MQKNRLLGIFSVFEFKNFTNSDISAVIFSLIKRILRVNEVGNSADKGTERRGQKRFRPIEVTLLLRKSLMSQRQNIIFWFGLVIVLIMTVFPPILKTVPGDDSGISSYRQIVHYEYFFTSTAKKIFLQRLFIQWFIAALITGGLMYTVRPIREPVE